VLLSCYMASGQCRGGWLYGKGGRVASSGRQRDVNKVGSCVEGGQGRDISCCARAINGPHSTGLNGAY
jgi:hypothetical protein